MGSATQEKQDKILQSREGSEYKPISRFLVDPDGDLVNGNIDASGGPESLDIIPANGEIWRIAKLIIYIEDNATNSVSGYGGGSVLTNGVKVSKVNTNGVTLDVFADTGIVLKNADFAKVGAKVEQVTMGTTNQILTATFDFRDFGSYVRLLGDNQESIAVTLNDDFTGLVQHYFFIQGYVEAGIGQNQIVA